MQQGTLTFDRFTPTSVRGLARRGDVRLDRDSADDIAAWSKGDVRRAIGAIQQLTFEAANKRVHSP